MNNMFYPQGKLCISSVQKKEEGFEDYRYTAYLAASSLGFNVIRNPEKDGMTQGLFEVDLGKDYPVFLLLVGTVESEVVNKEFAVALENCLPILVFIKKQDGKISKRSKNIIAKLSRASYDYECTSFSNCEELYNQVYERLKLYILNKEARRPVLEKGVSLAYRANTELMRKSKHQIVIYQAFI